jgi:hypothetical protein
MDVYRKEIGEFIRIAETLLSPASLTLPLTKEECHVVDHYVKELSVRYSGVRQTSQDNAAPTL